MPTETVDTMIIGGGLSGIYAAYLLSQRNKSFVVLEARDRIGGRPSASAVRWSRYMTDPTTARAPTD